MSGEGSVTADLSLCTSFYFPSAISPFAPQPASTLRPLHQEEWAGAPLMPSPVLVLCGRQAARVEQPAPSHGAGGCISLQVHSVMTQLGGPEPSPTFQLANSKLLLSTLLLVFLLLFGHFCNAM